MEDTNIEVSNKINNYKNLETLFADNLQKCQYKSDVVIVYAHYLLTQQLNYEYVEIQVECDQNGGEKENYKTVDTLPNDWSKNYRSYKLIYKKEKEIRFLTAQKSNRDLIVYFSKAELKQNKLSSNIILKNYIPDQFLKTNDLSLIDNLSELRNILLGCFLTDKVTAKREHDKDLIACGSIKKARITTPSTHDTRFGLGFSNSNKANIKELHLQKKDKHIPITEKETNTTVLDDPNFVLIEYPDGPPDQIYLT